MIRLHRFAVLLAVFTLALLLAGALVTSTGSGLAIPAWPALSGGETAVPGTALQQAHRLLAAVVGLLALAVVVLAWRADPRPWMKGLAVAATALVVAQAVYGGVAVLTLLPAYFSVFHAAFAQLFFVLTVAMALFTSKGWLEAEPAASRAADDRGLRRWAMASMMAIYAQVLLGAAMRHSYTIDGRPAGLAIPDYPLAFGQVVPIQQLSSTAVALSFGHRLMALVAAVLVTVTVIRVYRRHLAEGGLVRPASLLALLLLTQVVLGGLTVLSGMTPVIAALHAAAVAIALGAGLMLLLRSSRSIHAFADGTAATPRAGLQA